jgi:hypothetical protein
MTIEPEAEVTEEEIPNDGLGTDEVIQSLLDSHWGRDETGSDDEVDPEPEDVVDEPEAEEDSEVEDEELPARPGQAVTPTPAPVEPPQTFTLEQVQALLAQRQAQPPAPSPTYPTPQPPSPQPFPFPQVTEEDLENPAVRALLLVANEQHKRMVAMDQRLSSVSEIAQSRVERDSAEVIASATSSFKAKYDLPDDVMIAVRTKAREFAPLLDGKIAETGNPYEAVESILEIAYLVTPQAIRHEREYEAKHQAATSTRKKKLAGIGGGSGSAPSRNEPIYDLSTSEGRTKAAVAEVSAAMYGDEGDR